MCPSFFFRLFCGFLFPSRITFFPFASKSLWLRLLSLACRHFSRFSALRPHSFAHSLTRPPSHLQSSLAHSGPLSPAALRPSAVSSVPPARRAVSSVRLVAAAAPVPFFVLSLSVATAAATPQQPPKRSPNSAPSASRDRPVDMSAAAGGAADNAHDMLFKVSHSDELPATGHDAWTTTERASTTLHCREGGGTVGTADAGTLHATATATATAAAAAAAARHTHSLLADCLATLPQFIIIGDSGTGKSCLLRYFLEKKCETHANHMSQTDMTAECDVREMDAE